MYQAYVVQTFGDYSYNVILGDSFRTIDQAYRAVCDYENSFGKCSRAVINPAGTQIPTTEIPKETALDKIRKWF